MNCPFCKTELIKYTNTGYGHIRNLCVLSLNFASLEMWESFASMKTRAERAEAELASMKDELARVKGGYLKLNHLYIEESNAYINLKEENENLKAEHEEVTKQLRGMVGEANTARRISELEYKVEKLENQKATAQAVTAPDEKQTAEILGRLDNIEKHNEGAANSVSSSFGGVYRDLEKLENRLDALEAFRNETEDAFNSMPAPDEIRAAVQTAKTMENHVHSYKVKNEAATNFETMYCDVNVSTPVVGQNTVPPAPQPDFPLSWVEASLHLVEGACIQEEGKNIYKMHNHVISYYTGPAGGWVKSCNETQFFQKGHYRIVPDPDGGKA